MNYQCYLGPAKTPVVYTQAMKHEEGGNNNKTFNLQQYINVAFVSGTKDRLYQLSRTEFTSKTWTIYSPSGGGLCLPNAVFSNLYFLNNRSHVNFSNIYNEIFTRIIVEGLILYFRDGMLSCENGVVTRTWKESYLRPGKAFWFELNENNDYIHIFFENDKFTYFIDNTTIDTPPINNTLSKEDFVAFLMNRVFVNPYDQDNMDYQIVSLLARALKINICQITPPTTNDNSLFVSWFFGYKGEFNTIIDGFTDMTENNSMIILNESKNHYKFLDNTDRKQTLSKIREINLICKSKVPEVNPRGDIGAMEDPRQFSKGSVAPEIDPISSLVDLGFNENEAKHALHIFTGNVGEAAAYLFSERDKVLKKDSFAGVPKDKSSSEFSKELDIDVEKSNIQKLMGMGFDKEIATNALIANKNVEEAIASLLQGSDNPPIIRRSSQGEFALGELSAMENTDSRGDEAIKEIEKRKNREEMMRRELKRLGYEEGVDFETAIMEDDIKAAIDYLNSQGIKSPSQVIKSPSQVIKSPELTQLIEMGFPETVSREALINANNNVNGAIEILSQPIKSTKSPRIDEIGHSANPRNNSNVKQSPNQTPEYLRKLREKLFDILTHSDFSQKEVNAMMNIRGLSNDTIKDKLDRYNNLIRKGFNKKIVGKKNLINGLVVDETILKEIERKLSPELNKNLLKLEEKTGDVYDFNNDNCENIDVLSSFLNERNIEHDVGALEREMFLQKGYDPVDINEAVKIYNNCVDVDKFLSELQKIRQGDEILQLFDNDDFEGYIEAISLLEGSNVEGAKKFKKELKSQTKKILHEVSKKKQMKVYTIIYLPYYAKIVIIILQPKIIEILLKTWPKKLIVTLISLIKVKLKKRYTQHIKKMAIVF